MEFDHISVVSAQVLSQASASKNLTNLSRSDRGRSASETIPETTSNAVVTLSSSALQRLATFNSPAPKISFEVDGETKRIVANVVDLESGEVIQQIPILFLLHPSRGK